MLGLSVRVSYRSQRHKQLRSKPQRSVEFLSLVSILTRDIDDIGILSVCPSVCLSVRNVPVLDENGLTYCHSFFHRIT